MEKDDDKLCPSSTCSEGATVIGIVQSNQQVALLNYPLKVTPEFIEKVSNDDVSPEKRFRFSGKCLQSGCRQWENGKCGVIKELAIVNPHIEAGDLPKCNIRPQCRWFSEEGKKACALCPFVITDNREGLQNLPVPE